MGSAEQYLPHRAIVHPQDWDARSATAKEDARDRQISRQMHGQRRSAVWRTGTAAASGTRAHTPRRKSVLLEIESPKATGRIRSAPAASPTASTSPTVSNVRRRPIKTSRPTARGHSAAAVGAAQKTRVDSRARMKRSEERGPHIRLGAQAEAGTLVAVGLQTGGGARRLGRGACQKMFPAPPAEENICKKNYISVLQQTRTIDRTFWRRASQGRRHSVTALRRGCGGG